MEVVAGGASIAGLLSLAGQCVSGAQKLINLYQGICKASSTVQAFLNDINSLLRTLSDVHSLLQRIRNHSPHAFDDLHMTTLKIHLEDCNEDLGSWLGVAQANRTFGKGARTWFKDFWSAVNKDKVKNIRSEVQRRRQEIGVALSALGRYFPAQNTRSEDFHTKQCRSFDCHLASATAKIDRNVQDLVDLTPSYLERLEALSQSISEGIGSLQSLGSVCSSASRISRSSIGENASIPLHLTVSSTSSDDEYVQPLLRARRIEPSTWNCNTWTDREDLFCPRGQLEEGISIRQCSLCGHVFVEPPQWDIRMRHMEITHNLRQCSPEKEWSASLDLFDEHLTVAHNARTGNWLNTFRTACEAKPDTGLIRHVKSGHAEPLVEVASVRDRINRWMLDMLCSDVRQAKLHRKMLSKPAIHLEYDKLDEQAWGRLLVKYWFLDEAAVGHEFDIVAGSVHGSAVKLAQINSSIRGRSLASFNSGLNGLSLSELKTIPLLTNSRLGRPTSNNNMERSGSALYDSNSSKLHIANAIPGSKFLIDFHNRLDSATKAEHHTSHEALEASRGLMAEAPMDITLRKVHGTLNSNRSPTYTNGLSWAHSESDRSSAASVSDMQNDKTAWRTQICSEPFARLSPLEAYTSEDMQKEDPLGIQIWKLYRMQKEELPNSERFENLTWRMMSMNLRRKELGQRG